MSERAPLPDTPMRLVKIECTGNDVSAIGYVSQADDETIIDWAQSWVDAPEKAFEGSVYVALNIPAPPDFTLEYGAFYFYDPPERGATKLNADGTWELPSE